MTPTTVLAVQSVSCHLRQQPVLDAVTFSVREQELICVLGPHDSGKTTLLQAIAGLLPVAKGEIALVGERMSTPMISVPAHQRPVGLVFQDYALFPHLTGQENLAFACPVPMTQEHKDAVQEMLTLLGLTECAARYPRDLSAEQQLRVALGRALLCKPHLLLLDAPFPAMDSQQRDRLIAEIRDLLKQRQIAAILATLSREDAFALSDHVVLLHEGKVIQQGNPYELYYRPVQRAVADFLGNTNYLPITVLSEHQWQSPMGDFHANYPLGFPIGSQCDWLVRPQEIALALDPDGAALIEDRVFLGTSNVYRVRLAERVLTVQTSNWFEPGQQVRISIRPDQPILFPALPLEPVAEENAS
ncbi:sugar ABC transporter [Candidatus Symbiopectobacterium sp. 'North America']|uniref:ABC transporter ATP-binding protein n=1 Tax=Candidatus Symbiopectobacterium sp. 'North America' TaxID=2794574 RepID=UPI0018CB6C9E|nr:ABC transporter ATP-binding protein [Candidatus Symbiopectobacterium sp. 'North America']MBG6243779.1 sugar ABC transporter [Candidatus Symbiopectobacterium sp. 'North America']